MITLIAYHSLPNEFYIGKTKFVKYSNFWNGGFKIRISHETINNLKSTSDVTNGTLGLIQASGGIAAITATGTAIAAPIGLIVSILVSSIKIYLGLIKKRDKGNGVDFIFFLGLLPPPLVKTINS